MHHEKIMGIIEIIIFVQYKIEKKFKETVYLFNIELLKIANIAHKIM